MIENEDANNKEYKDDPETTWELKNSDVPDAEDVSHADEEMQNNK